MSRDPGPSSQEEHAPDVQAPAAQAITPRERKLMVLLIVLTALALVSLVSIAAYAASHTMWPSFAAGGTAFGLVASTGPSLVKLWFHGP
ncbi:hypothetical protein ACFZCU_47620 [Streptomyces canus]|jgi:hypothetical protein|uniref:hypothetical protein n=1 Tax=Streptomyces canus TaxID=58343 RepID=UPI0036E9391B